MKKRRMKVEVGSGNIFADLGLPDAEELLLKSQIVVALHRLIKVRKLTQSAAAKLIGVKQPDLSNILRGHYQGFSLARLMRMHTAFDQESRSPCGRGGGNRSRAAELRSMRLRREQNER